jgi:hypothetical protein
VQNVKVLRKLGYAVPEHIHGGINIRRCDGGIGVLTRQGIKFDRNKRLCRVELTNSGTSFVITKDLTADGFSVAELNASNLKGLTNYSELRNQHDSWKAELLKIAQGENPRYGMDVLAHTEEQGKPPEEAIDHMFILTTKGKVGRLTLGDLNHVKLYEK